MLIILKIYVCMYFLFRYESYCKGSNDSGEIWKGKNYMYILIKLWFNNLLDKRSSGLGWWVVFICNGLFEDDNILLRKRCVVEIEFLGFKCKIFGVRN